MATILLTDILMVSPPFELEGVGEYSIFYERLATDMDDMMVSISNNLDAIVKLLGLLNYMVDLTLDLDFDVNRAMLDIYYVLRDDVLRDLNVLPRDRFQVLQGVFAVNEHTKRYIANDLTYYVNNEIWPDSCIPYEWAKASEETGEDISGWNICEPS